MTRKWIVILMALLVSGFAMAGQYAPQPLTLDLVNRTAAGDLVTVRFSANETEYIGCGIRAFDDGAGGATWFGFCQARNEKEEVGFCNTANAELLSAIMATADFSYVTFSWNEAGECTRIGYSTQSFFIPKPLMP